MSSIEIGLSGVDWSMLPAGSTSSRHDELRPLGMEDRTCRLGYAYYEIHFCEEKTAILDESKRGNEGRKMEDCSRIE